MKDDPISFWLSDGLAWIKPSGDACHLNAPQVKNFAKKMILRGSHYFAVDLGECTGMDDNFIGTLAGIALRLHVQGPGKLQIVRCPAELDVQLRSLGLDALFEV